MASDAGPGAEDEDCGPAGCGDAHTRRTAGPRGACVRRRNKRKQGSALLPAQTEESELSRLVAQGDIIVLLVPPSIAPQHNVNRRLPTGKRLSALLSQCGATALLPSHYFPAPPVLTMFVGAPPPRLSTITTQVTCTA